jgi:hypothetical protein
MAFGLRRKGEHLDDHLPLSQYGSSTRPKGGPAFRSSPRDGKDNDGISMSRGRLSAEQAHSVVGLQAAREGDGVRWTTVGILRSAGFVVTAKPTQGNPNHVVVSLASGDAWGNQHATRFEECFTEDPQWLGRDVRDAGEGGTAK